MGAIWSAVGSKGLIRLNLPCAEKTFLDELDRQIDTEPEYRPGKLDELSLWLRDYFKGDKQSYSEPFDQRGTKFQKRVWKEIIKIPYGRLTSYGLIAKSIGKPNASRAVGNAVGQNPLSIVIPCHRVVWSNGGIGGFGGGLERKRFLLNVEGLLPRAEGEPEKGVDLSQYFYNR
ncbi:methylated-DNA--[protein]-cysteine S-methyltransferase [Candidatus Bathyarchaeota archaeon]|nr:methylated-DNA--[protein]-cysteine S-methyltransferase [Candidatus Bathyarchaeota archaeon]